MKARKSKSVPNGKSAAEGHEAAIRLLDRAGIASLWSAVKVGDTPDWPAGKALEYLVLRLFELDGAEVKYPCSVRDVTGLELEQLDGVVHFQHLTCLVECKDSTTPRNIEPIAKLRGQLLRRPSGLIGVVFARKGFTEPARVLATYTGPNAILLWTGDDLEYVLAGYNACTALVTKYRWTVSHALPDFDLTTLGIP